MGKPSCKLICKRALYHYIPSALWVLSGVVGFVDVAHAQTPQNVTVQEQNYFSDVTLGLQIEGGMMANSSSPKNGLNFGQLLASQSNQPLLNQIALTLTKPVDPLGGGYGLGVNIQLLYGADARSYTITGISDRWLNNRYQVTPIQANIALHMPWITKEGLDGQIGIIPSPMGAESLDPTSRAFYTMAYTTEYSTPFEHVGGYFQQHLNKNYSILYGIDVGNQVSFGRGNNNGSPAGYVGFNAADLCDKKLTITYLFRIGPENSWRALGHYHADHAQRYWNDLVGTWVVSPKITLTGELNQVHDEGLHADTWGAVVWGGYQLEDALSVNIRTEIYRDSKGAFVTSYGANEGYSKAILGLPTASYSAGPTTYGDLTLNMVWKPKINPNIKTLQIRPEIRFDRALNTSRPFDDFTHKSRILIGGDVTVGF